MSRVIIGLLVVLLILLIFYVLAEHLPYAFDGSKKVPIDWDKTGPSTCAGVLYINEHPYLFVGGGLKQPDVLLGYSDDRLSPIKVFDKPDNVITHCMAIGDLSNSTREDIVVGRSDGVYIYHNKDSGGGQVRIAHIDPGEVPTAITLADHNHSGSLSIFVAISGGKNLLLVKSAGSVYKNIAGEAGLDTENDSTAAMFVDINGDGHADLVLTGERPPIEIFRNTGGNRFILVDPPTITSKYYKDIILANADTTTLFLINSSYPPISLTHQGGYKFKTAPVNEISPADGATMSDYNLDGHVDIFTSKSTGKLLGSTGMAYKWSNSKGKFVEQKIFDNRDKCVAAVPMDISRNDILDLIWVNSDKPSVAYLNSTKPNYVNVMVPRNDVYANARISLSTDGDTQYRQHILDGKSSQLIQFGLGDDTPAEIIIDLVNGKRKRTKVSPNETIFAVNI